MSEGQLVSLVALMGALVLVGSGFQRRQLGARKTLGMALIWIGIITAVALAFGTMQ